MQMAYDRWGLDPINNLFLSFYVASLKTNKLENELPANICRTQPTLINCRGPLGL